MQIELFKKAVVWTKPNCPACETVKNLLASKDYTMELHYIDKAETLEELRRVLPGVRTVPQVFISGRYIGGLEDVRKYLDRK